ncbi:RidA family protein [Mesorhizobium sp. M7A.F.Ca.MR.148.00.0.0]|uniref:RidA family protein n=1 Tax=Mesorhizobium sp. M7A.F.Ca.MR.148.00.0.0 TaxID=2496775 RepID=UPI001FE03DD3|nr:RidA family protein [Mesorhizobium sp. M7A.F.Ca.MR.148.00.0.0]
MELVTHRKFKNGRLMPWGKSTVVTGAKGLVYLCGNTATAEKLRSCRKERRGLPWRCGGTVARNFGEHQIRSGRTRQRARLSHPADLLHQGAISRWRRSKFTQFRLDVLDEFFAEHCPSTAAITTRRPRRVIGVAALAQADIVVEIVAVAALSD